MKLYGFALILAAAMCPVSVSARQMVGVLEEKLTPTHPGAALFGASVSISGDILAVGAPWDTGPTGFCEGSYYAYHRNATTNKWDEEVYVVECDGDDVGMATGASVSASGNRIAIGAPAQDFGGWVYVIARNGTTWTGEMGIPDFVYGFFTSFGQSVALSGDTVLMNAQTSNTFVRVDSGTGWVHQDQLQAAGVPLAIDGDTAVAGTRIYVRSGTTWSEQAELSPAGGATGAFGNSVAISGDTVVIGDPLDADSASNAGAAYVFNRIGTVWVEQAKLLASDAAADDYLATSVSIDGDSVVLGAPFSDDGAADAGAAYVFGFDGSVWSEQLKLTAEAPAAGDRFGVSVSNSAGRVAIGAPNNFPEPGSAYVFRVIKTSSFCDASDGSLASCPCANAGTPDSGCDVASGTGGVSLEVLSQEIAPLNRLTLAGTGFTTMGSPAVLAIRGAAIEPSPIQFGDGLRCVGLPVVRLNAVFAVGGTAVMQLGHGPMGGPGTFSYQFWFRDQPAMFCTPEPFNLSSGRQVVW
jgi:hypothetical protein